MTGRRQVNRGVVQTARQADTRRGPLVRRTRLARSHREVVMARRRDQPLVGGSSAWRWRVAAIGVAVLAANFLLGSGGAATESHRPGQWIAFTRFVPALDDDATFVANLATGEVRRLFPGASTSPHWSPDGRLVTILGCGNPPACTTAAILVNPDTGHYRVLLMPAPNRIFTACNIWSPDGRRLACEGEGLDDPSLSGVYTMKVAGGGLRRVTWNPTGGLDGPADYSADG